MTNLFDNIKTRIGNQRFGNADAFGGLEVFEQGGDDARQGQRRAVERVRQLGFLVGVLVAELETVGLERLEVRDGGNLQPAFLRFGVNLEVVGERRGERHVAAAQTQDAVGQAERLDDRLDMRHHAVQRFVRVLGQAAARSRPCRTGAGGSGRARPCRRNRLRGGSRGCRRSFLRGNPFRRGSRRGRCS